MLKEKYRPKKFSDIIGNKEKIKLLQKMTIEGILPKFLFLYGIPGVSKTTIGYVISRYIACTSELKKIKKEPCGTCPNCLKIDETLYKTGKGAEELNVYTFDMALNQDDGEYIANIAKVIENKNLIAMRTQPIKIILIEELHCVKKQELQQMLLKTLENVPPNTHIILTTHEPQNIANAIKERADIELELLNPSKEEMTEHLYKICVSEKINITKRDCQLIANSVGNNPREALTKLNIAFLGGEEGVDVLVKQEYIELENYIKYFKAIEEGPANIAIFLEDLNEKSSFLLGLKRFIKISLMLKFGQLKKQYSKEMITKISEVTAPYKANELVEELNKISNIYQIKSDDADTHLLLIAFNLNKKLLKQVIVAEKNTVEFNSKDETVQEEVNLLINEIGKYNPINTIDDL